MQAAQHAGDPTRHPEKNPSKEAENAKRPTDLLSFALSSSVTTPTCGQAGASSTHLGSLSHYWATVKPKNQRICHLGSIHFQGDRHVKAATKQMTPKD